MTATSENMAEVLPDIERVVEQRDCDDFWEIVVEVP